MCSANSSSTAPEQMMTGKAQFVDCKDSCKDRPSIPGISISSNKQSVRLKTPDSTNCATEANGSVANPAACNTQLIARRNGWLSSTMATRGGVGVGIWQHSLGLLKVAGRRVNNSSNPASEDLLLSTRVEQLSRAPGVVTHREEKEGRDLVSGSSKNLNPS